MGEIAAASQSDVLVLQRPKLYARAGLLSRALGPAAGAGPLAREDDLPRGDGAAPMRITGFSPVEFLRHRNARA